jgi:hypothetical protein
VKETLAHLGRFLVVMLAVDLLGLGLCALLPAGTGPRQFVLFGTLVVAPAVAFLVTYGPAVRRDSP